MSTFVPNVTALSLSSSVLFTFTMIHCYSRWGMLTLCPSIEQFLSIYSLSCLSSCILQYVNSCSSTLNDFDGILFLHNKVLFVYSFGIAAITTVCLSLHRPNLVTLLLGPLSLFCVSLCFKYKQINSFEAYSFCFTMKTRFRSPKYFFLFEII